MSDDEFYNRVLPTFNRLNAGVGATVVVLVGFLAAIWEQNPELIEATLDAIFFLGLAFLSYVFITFIESLFGHKFIDTKFEKNYRETIRVYNLIILFY